MALLIESDSWKYLLGNNLGTIYKNKLNEMVDFIKAQEKILNKPIKDLDDCRVAMKCLETIRENFIEMDMDLSLMEEAYALFVKYKIDVPKEDIERVESLRFNFQNMINHVTKTKFVLIISKSIRILGQKSSRRHLQFTRTIIRRTNKWCRKIQT